MVFFCGLTSLGLGTSGRVSTLRLSLGTAGLTYSQILPASTFVLITSSHSSQSLGPARVTVVRCTLDNKDIVSGSLVWQCTDLFAIADLSRQRFDRLLTGRTYDSRLSL